jgi:hypothetical protein
VPAVYCSDFKQWRILIVPGNISNDGDDDDDDGNNNNNNNRLCEDDPTQHFIIHKRAKPEILS